MSKIAIKPFKGQDYNKLVTSKKYSKSKLFTDPKFGAVESSLYYKKKPTCKIVWKRPSVSSI